jgi:integrase
MVDSLLRRGAIAPGIYRFDERSQGKGFFEPEQFQAVLKHLPDHLKPVFQVAYITGWRVPSEVLTRRWQHVDLEGGGSVWNREKARTTKAGCFR